MAAERPENAEEQRVSQALQAAFGEPVPPAAFLAGRDAVHAAAAQAAQDIAADTDLVTAALTGAFAVEVDAATKADHMAAIRAAAQAEQAGNVIPLRRLGHRVGRHAVAAMVAVSSLAGGTGVAAASSDALPGQALYPVKRAVEQVMLTAAWTPSAESRVQTQLAARRLVEAEMLLASGASPELVEPLLDEYEQHVAVVEELGVSGAALEVAVLDEKAAALREQATVAIADEPGAETGTAVEPTETSAPTVTTTPPPTTTATETTAGAGQQGAPAPAPSATTSTTTSGAPSSDSGTGTSGPPPPAPEPEPEPQPSPDPSPTPSPTTTPPQSEVDEGKGEAPGENKPKPPKPTPTVDPNRTPLPDSEPVPDSGPLADWEEQSYADDES